MRDAALQISWLETISCENAWFKGMAYLITKKIMDYAFVLATLPLWLPLIVCIMILIKIGNPIAPIFFTQSRTGKAGKRFHMYKFRTMVPNAEALKTSIVHLNELHWPDFKVTNDPRVTPIGRLLRKTSLDELPQLVNVLKGEMSLVGPRPTSFMPNTYSLWHTERLDVLPGITGLWQIIARGSADFDTRMRLDIAYVERRCLWLDIQILGRTFLSLFQHHGVY